MQINRRQFTFMAGLATGGLFLPRLAFSADGKEFRVAQLGNSTLSIPMNPAMCSSGPG